MSCGQLRTSLEWSSHGADDNVYLSLRCGGHSPTDHVVPRERANARFRGGSGVRPILGSGKADSFRLAGSHRGSRTDLFEEQSPM